VLNNAVRNLIQKAKYKRGKSTRQLSQDLASKGLSGSKNSVWKFMKNKGWKPFKQQKKPLLTEKQQGDRLRFAKITEICLPKNEMIFFSLTNVRNICLNYRISKMTSSGDPKKDKFLLPIKSRKVPNGLSGAE